jgi:hypothetical protein
MSRLVRLPEGLKSRALPIAMLVLMLLPGFNAHADEWKRVTGKEALEAIYSDVVQQGDLTRKAKWRTEYCANGTGILRSWGQVFPRTWRVVDDKRVCITSDGNTKVECFRYEKHTSKPNTFRGRDVVSRQVWEFTILDEEPAFCKAEPDKAVASPPAAVPAPKASSGPSAAEMAKKLANPTLAIGQMTSSFITSQYRGTLPDSVNQDSLLYRFQPVLPFPTGDGKSFLLRPSINVLFDQPVFNPTTNSFEEQSIELGDLPFDFVYGGTGESGLLLSYGIAGSIPTATSDKVGSDQWTLGPEILLGQTFSWGVVGLLANHQWDVAGSNDADTSITAGQYFYGVNLGGGLFLASGPGFSYNHNATSGNKFTFPLGIGVNKTTKIGNRVWKFAFEYFYYLESPDVFGPQHQLKFSITPVVELPWSR